MLAEFAEKKDDYNKFYEQFGKFLKLGIDDYNKFYEQFDKFLKLGSNVDFTIDGWLKRSNILLYLLGEIAWITGSLGSNPSGPEASSGWPGTFFNS